MGTVQRVTLSALLFMAAGSATAQVTEVELEYWRSVQRIDTPSAYRAYLNMYPKGAFASLAQLKAGPEAAATAPAKPAEALDAASATARVAKPGGTLRNFSEPVNGSGEFAFDLGARLNGPGVLTIGAMGAKKQMVLPSGEWVVLAAVDTKSVQPSGILNTPRANVVALTTLVTAKFSGNRLLSLMRITGSRQIATASQWVGLDDCDAKAAGAALQHQRWSGGLRDDCQSIQIDSDPLGKSFAASEATRSSLDKLGATVSGTALVSTFVFSGSRSGYLGVTRIDWPGVVLGAAADRASAWRAEALEAAPVHAGYLKGLSEWASSYRALAADGFTRRLETSDLVANKPGPASAELSAATDFDPAALGARK